MRLFFAIYPNKELKDYCRDVYRAFDKEKRNLKQAPLEQLHITVRYIGSKVSDYSKDLLLERMRAMRGSLPKPVIQAGQVRFGFPRQHDPRVLFAEIASTPELLNLQDVLNHEVRKLGRRDVISWKPHQNKDFHITIARLKAGATRSGGKRVKQILKDTHIPFPPAYNAEELVAVQSIINSHGKPIYRILERIPL